MKEIYKNALKSWHKLKHIVETFNGTLEELCDKLYGHNLEDDLFDVNFEMICGTITKEENKLKLTNYFEIWDYSNLNYLGLFTVEYLEQNT